MVLALQGTASLNVVKDQDKWFEAIQLGKEYPEKQFLLNFLELYKDIKSERNYAVWLQQVLSRYEGNRLRYE